MDPPHIEIYTLAERLHRQYLDVIQLELDRARVSDLSAVRAMILYNIGNTVMTASELMWRGCYLGTNVSYNLKKLTEAGYITQSQSPSDGRVTIVRSSEKGRQICRILHAMNKTHDGALAVSGVSQTDLDTSRRTLKALQKFWGRVVENANARTGAPAGAERRVEPPEAADVYQTPGIKRAVLPA